MRASGYVCNTVLYLRDNDPLHPHARHDDSEAQISPKLSMLRLTAGRSDEWRSRRPRAASITAPISLFFYGQAVSEGQAEHS